LLEVWAIGYQTSEGTAAKRTKLYQSLKPVPKLLFKFSKSAFRKRGLGSGLFGTKTPLKLNGHTPPGLATVRLGAVDESHQGC
jgi:hypothetical protein